MQVKTLFTLSVLIALCGVSETYASPVYFLVAYFAESDRSFRVIVTDAGMLHG